MSDETEKERINDIMKNSVQIPKTTVVGKLWKMIGKILKN